MSSNADPSKYPGLDVLINKRDIRDAARLDKFEHERSSLRGFDLQQSPIKGYFDLEHIKTIHQHLFQDVYEWAGKTRSVFLMKGGSMFAHPDFIEKYWQMEHKKIEAQNFLRGMDKEKFTGELARHYGEINAIHPFREGNGRSTRVYLTQLAKEAGYELDYSKVDKGRWNEAAKQSFDTDPKAMQQVFAAIATPTKAIAFDRDKPQDAVRKHPTLKSAFLTIKTAEVYAARVINDPASRHVFVSQTRENIREMLADGKDVPEPKTISRGQGMSR